MEFRRRRRTRGRQRAGGKGGGSGMHLIIGLVFAAAVIYLISASKVGTWLAENVVAPVFKAFDNEEPTVGDNSPIISGEVENAPKNAVSENISLTTEKCYMLQMGVFSTLANAEAQSDQLRAQGAAGYILEDGGRYRVFAAGYESEASAREVLNRLKSEEVDCTLYILEGNMATFKVTASEAAITSFKELFVTFDDVIGKLGEEVILFDKNKPPIEEEKAVILSFINRLESCIEFLNSQQTDDAVITKVKSAYTAISGALNDLYDLTTTSSVTFSSAMKHTHLGISDRYNQLVKEIGG